MQLQNHTPTKALHCDYLTSAEFHLMCFKQIQDKTTQLYPANTKIYPTKH